MRLREPGPIRKHICTYDVTDEYLTDTHHFIERTCPNCNKVQTARFEKPLELPVALLPYTDAQWFDERMREFFDKSHDLVA